MFSDNMKIRCDIKFCQYLQAKRIKFKIIDPLEHSINLVAKMDELPIFFN